MRTLLSFISSVIGNTRTTALAALAVSLFLPISSVRAASGTWNGTSNAAWTNSANWSASPYPSGSDTATFDNAGNGNTSISVTGLSSLLNITFTGPSVAAYTVGTSGQEVLLSAGATILLTADAANGQTVQTGFLLPGGNSPATFRNDNPLQTLAFGNVYGYTTGTMTKSLYIRGMGPVTFQGDLTRYLSILNLYHQTTNTLTLNGNAQLTQLALDGTNAVLNIASGKTMTFSNVGGYNIVASQDSVINGPGAIVLSTNVGDDHANNSAATGKTLTINAKLTGDTGFQLWHETNYGTIVLNGANDYTRSTVINVPGTLQFSTIGNSGAAGNLGAGTNIVLDHASCRFRYVGAGETTDRVLDVKAGGIFEHAGSGILVFTAPTASSTSGSKTLTLRNFAAAAGENSGAIQNGSGTVSVAKEGDGTWSLTADNTYSGSTSVAGGTLSLAGRDGAITNAGILTLSGATLLLDNTAAANNVDRLRDTMPITLNDGTLAFANDGGAADFSETVGTVTVSQAGARITVGQASVSQTSTLTLAGLNRSAGSLDFCGDGLGESDRCRLFIIGQGDGLIGPWAIINGTNYAAYSSTLGVYASGSTVDIAARGPDSVIPNDAGLNVRISLPGTDGPITLETSPESSVGALMQNSATPATVTTTSTLFKTATVLIAEDKADLTIGASVGDGQLAALEAGGSLLAVNRAAAAVLTVNADITDNASASTLSVSAPGPVVLNGAVGHTGTTTVNDGILTFGGQDVSQRVANAIGGTGGIAKSGTNLLQLTTANTYAGTTHIYAGIVRVGQGTAFGSTAVGTVVEDGATLDVGGSTSADTLDLRQEPVTIQGIGTDGAGAVVNRSAYQQIYALGKVELAGDTTFGGSARWDIRDGAFAMNDHAVTKIGASTVSLSGSTAVTPGGNAASFDVQEGTLRLQQTAQLNGSALNTVHLHSGTTLDFYDLVSSPTWGLVCDDNTRYNVDNSGSGTQNIWGGPVTLNGTLYLTSDGAFNAGFAGAISGSGSLFKTNDHSIYITGTNNTYAGPTRAIGGWLYVNSIRNVGLPSSLGQPMTVEDGTIQLGGGGTAGRIVYRGTGDVCDRVIDMAGVTGWTTLSQEGTGPLVYSNLTVTTPGAKILYLIGNSTSTAEIVASVVNSASGNTTLEKQNSSTWILSGNCTYSGNTTVQDGNLIFKGNSTLAGATTINKGAIEYWGNNTLAGATTINNGTIKYWGTNVLGSTLTASSGAASIYGTNAYGSGAAIYVGISNGTLKVTTGARLTCANNFRIGQPNGSGAFYLDGGTFTNAQGAGEQNFNFGCENNSYGYLRMTGGTVNAGRIQTGGYSSGTTYGTGVIRIEGGTLTFPDWIILGRRVGGKCTVTLDGGTLTHGTVGEFALCRNGGDAEINVTGGTLDNSSTAITFHNLDTGSGTGIVNLCAGRLTTRYFLNKTSYTTNGGAYLMFAGGTLAPSADFNPFVPANMTGVYAFDAFEAYPGGAVIDTDGKNITIPAGILAPTGQSVASIALAAPGSGYIGEPYVVIEGNGAGATAVANLADDGTGKGTFKIASVTMTCPGVNYTVAPTVTLRGGGSNITAAVIGTVTLGANAGGGLTKTGAGILTLTGTNTYAGATTVSNGTLSCASFGALPPGTDINLVGGMIDLGGYSRTNGAVTATSGSIVNGSLIADSFTKTGSGSLTLATPLASSDPIVIESGTLSLVPSHPGLYEGPLAGSFNTTEAISTNVLIQPTTRAANVNTYPPWGTNMTFVYTGYIWNRASTNVTWTFGENVDDSSLLKIDGTTLLNNGVWDVPTIATYTLTPGAHAFETRFGNGSGGAGKVYSAWWTTAAFGFGVDYQGRNETNIANFVALTDPGDGSLLTVGAGGMSNQIAAAASVVLGSGAVLDLAGTVQTLANLSGSGTVSNGTLAVTGTLAPGGDAGVGTLTVSDGTVLGSGVLRIDVAADGDCDRLAIQGDTDLSNLTLEIANPEMLDKGKVYTVATCTGARTGTFASVTVPDSRWHAVYRSDGSVQLLFTQGLLIRVL